MIVFIALKLLLLISLVLSGYNLSKRTTKGKYYYPYWITVMPVIVTYTLVEGLRYARATDYFSYFNSFLGLIYIDFEPVFALFVYVLSTLNAPFYSGFLFCSFFLIYTGGLLIKEFRFVGLFALPLFYLDTIVQSSNLVRMYVALSFVFLALRYLLQNKSYKVILFFVLAFFTHYSTIVLVPFVYLFHKYQNPFKSRLVILVLYVLALNVSIGAEFVNEYLIRLKGFGIYENLLGSTDRWLIGDNIDTIENNFSLFYYIRFYVTPICLIWLGYPFIHKYKRYKYNVFYHLYVVGALLIPMALTLPTELFYRLCLYFLSFKFIILSFILYEYFNKSSKFNFMSKAFIFIIFLDSIYLLVKTIVNYSTELGYQFVWDKI